MKKVLVCALALLLIAAALAEGVYYGEMVVMHCQEWVSLRSEPSTDSQRLAKVPLGTAVQDCVLASGGFIQCEYKGMQGYILGDYLEPIDNGESASGMTEASAAGSVAADDPANAYGQIDRVVDDVHVVAARSYSNGTVETLDVTCYGAQGEKLWSRALHAEPTELTCTAAYIGGTAQSPRLMLYSYDRGLMSCDLRTGAIYWTLTPEDVLGVMEYEHAQDAIASLGGQTAINLAAALQREGVNIIGTGVDAIDRAEDRHEFEELLLSLNIPQPRGTAVTNLVELAEIVCDTLSPPAEGGAP